eukprot:268331-Chlamydomonas_euryale.AAC.3
MHAWRHLHVDTSPAHTHLALFCAPLARPREISRLAHRVVDLRLDRAARLERSARGAQKLRRPGHHHQQQRRQRRTRRRVKLEPGADRHRKRHDRVQAALRRCQRRRQQGRGGEQGREAEQRARRAPSGVILPAVVARFFLRMAAAVNAVLKAAGECTSSAAGGSSRAGDGAMCSPASPLPRADR